MRLFKSVLGGLAATFLSVVVLILGWYGAIALGNLLIDIFRSGNANAIFSSIAVVGLLIGYTIYFYKENE